MTLFSWLLPLVAIILLGFLASLPFISLAPLWQTHFATALLLAEIALLVLLINACYQDGAAEKSTSRIKRWAGTLGAIELVPLAGLAIWALSLRVGQYGWSAERIMAAAILVVASCYALGYASALVLSPSWLKRIEAANFATAYVVLALILALFSPIADPARLMVADQVARLKSGVLAADKFDFVALKFDGARWGAAALAELGQAKDGAEAPVIAAKAAQALAATNRYVANQNNATHRTPEELAARVTVFPGGKEPARRVSRSEFRVVNRWDCQPMPARDRAEMSGPLRDPASGRGRGAAVSRRLQRFAVRSGCARAMAQDGSGDRIDFLRSYPAAPRGRRISRLSRMLCPIW